MGTTTDQITEDGGTAAAVRAADNLQALEALAATEAANTRPLAGETLAFTGTLASMTHRAAMELVEQHGGRASQAVTSHTTMLVIGEEGWPLEADGRTSQKLQQASQSLADGHAIRIVAESDWLLMLGLDDRRDEIRKAHTPAMLSRLLDVPVRLIRRWARLGLIRPVRRVGRLPWFDYREVASARRLAALLEEGVSAETLEKSLAELGRTIAGTDRSLAQLNLLVRDETVLLRDDRGVIIPRTGQRLLDFDTVEPPRVFSESSETAATAAGDAPKSPAAPISRRADTDEPNPVLLPFTGGPRPPVERSMADWNAEEWFHEGCRLTEESELESAINAFRNSLSLLGSERGMRANPEDPLAEERLLFPDPADVNFHLADALYREGRTEAAVERYYCAIESAPDYIEAWTQLGCLQAELGEMQVAEQSLCTALSIHPGNPDVVLHYAQLLDRTGRSGEAAEYWSQYLQHDTRGPWADHARDRLAARDVATPTAPGSPAV